MKLERLQAAATLFAAGQMSFSDIREEVCEAICTKEGAGFSCYIIDIYPDSVVYVSMGTDGTEKTYQRSYSILDGVVTLGDATEVERQVTYIPLQAAGHLLSASGDPAGEDFGYTWQVQICKYGPADGRAINWPREPLVAAIPLYEGARVFCLMDTQHVQAADRPCGKSVREIVGWTENVTDSGTALVGTFQILKAAKWLRDMAVDSFQRGKQDLFGFSHDVQALTKTTMVAGRAMKEPVTIKAVEIDVVYRPTNEGKLLQMIAASDQKGDQDMLFEKLLAALKNKRPELCAQIQAGIAAGTMTQDQALEQIAAATVKDSGGDATNQTLVAAVVAELKPLLAATPAGPSAELQQIQLIASGMTLTSTLQASKLPEAIQNKLRVQFKDKVFKEEDLQAAVKIEKECLDALTGSGAVTGAGDVRVTIGREGVDKLQAAFDGMLGVQLADTMKDVPVFTSIRAAYVEMTGDVDINGVLNPAQQRRMQAAYGDTTFAYALGNTLYRRLTQDYRAFGDYGVSRLVGSNIRNAVDFRTLQSIRIGYYGDIPTVNTDTDDYPDLGEVGDEKIEYALAEKGGIITINRKTIINDDLRLIQRIISRLPRAGRRTVARTVWTPFLTNAVYKGDSKAIFHVDHGNLGSTAYGIASAEAAKTAMFNQQEPNSNERIGLSPVTVAFPSELNSLVTNVNNFNPQAVAIENGNSMYGYFKPDGLFKNPFQTDTNDWMMFADPNECEIVELAYLNGQQEPVMMVADNPSTGQMFVKGAIQYRITHDHNAEVVDYRGAYKGIVA